MTMEDIILLQNCQNLISSSYLTDYVTLDATTFNFMLDIVTYNFRILVIYMHLLFMLIMLSCMGDMNIWYLFLEIKYALHS